jgi:uncharacterized protein (TIGR01440 family)
MSVVLRKYLLWNNGIIKSIWQVIHVNGEVFEPQNDHDFLQSVYNQMSAILTELLNHGNVQCDQMVVIGCSTSEVIGGQIGKAGTELVAEQIYRAVRDVRSITPFLPVFQCCEHLNRALVMERETSSLFSYEEVRVVPVSQAGGAMAAYAYRQMSNACVVEKVRAHAAVDIGNTLIGMHLREVAVPFRPSVRVVGQAHVTAAFTRPKLIGGSRAVY